MHDAHENDMLWYNMMYDVMGLWLLTMDVGYEIYNLYAKMMLMVWFNGMTSVINLRRMNVWCMRACMRWCMAAKFFCFYVFFWNNLHTKWSMNMMHHGWMYGMNVIFVFVFLFFLWWHAHVWNDAIFTS